ncbi:MAG: LPP20 family lipoprotein [Treponema sp.]|nr:LPP20 family lipoprotein [Spirochaetia bacterium]MDD7460341.1 LPP20 family lipoprotein [Spirochaetales bacterium]MDY5812571.1 LPP20 family lipoprotein [Treponema sp.]
MKKFFCLILAGILFQLAFAKTPQWVNNPSKAYPAKDYFTAVGSGKSEQQAELSAVENLAAIFGRNVRASSKTSSRLKQAEENGTVSVGKTSDFSKDIMQRVSVEDLIGIELKEYHNDGKKFYALAVMDKKKTEDILTSSIRTNNQRIENLLCATTTELYTLETYARFDFAREIAELDENFFSKLEVINVKSAEEFKGKMYTGSFVRSQMLDVARAIPVYVNVNGPEKEKVFLAVSEMFSDFGFRVIDTKGSRYTFYVKTEQQNRETTDKKTVQCMYSFDGQLKDETEMEFLWSTSFTGRESSSSLELLPSKTQRTMAKKIKEDCGRSFGKFLSTMRTE